MDWTFPATIVLVVGASIGALMLPLAETLGSAAAEVPTAGASTIGFAKAFEDAAQATAFSVAGVLLIIDGVLRVSGRKTITATVAETWGLPDPLANL